MSFSLIGGLTEFQVSLSIDIAKECDSSKMSCKDTSLSELFVLSSRCSSAKTNSNFLTKLRMMVDAT